MRIDLRPGEREVLLDLLHIALRKRLVDGCVVERLIKKVSKKERDQDV